MSITKKFHYFLFIFIGLFLFFSSNSPDAKAQSCSGSITCCLETATSCRNAAGNNCLAGSPGCTCTTSCNNWDIPQTCRLTSGGNSCQVTNGCGFAQGGCSYTPPASTPPPGTPTPGGWGACGSCSGCPGGNASQCRTDPGGACVWDPGGCGGGGGGPSSSCNITTTGPFTVRVGQRIAVSISASGTGGGTFGNASFFSVGPGSGNFIIPGGWGTVGPPRPYEGRIEGTAVGTRYLRVNIENGTGCTRDIPVNIVDLSLDLDANGSDGPITIPTGTAATLSWVSNGGSGTVCTASGGWTGTKTLNGSEQTPILNASTTFSLQCVSGAGTRNDSVTVNVSAPPPAAPTVNLLANNSNGPISITSGTAANLTWTATNATTCTASNGWTGTKAIPSGSQSTGNLSANTTFVLTCTGPGGSASDSVQVNISSPPPPAAPTVNLLVNSSNGPISITSGTAASLSWTTTNATTCTASNGWTGTKAVPSGSQSTGNLNTNTTFVLTCTGAGGSASDSVTVNVIGLPPAPTVDLTANASNGPITVTSGTSVTLAWTTANATSCTSSASVATAAWSGAKATSGSQASGSITSSRTFTLTCTGTGGSASDSVTVNVSVTPAPTVDLLANSSNGPLSVTSGTSVTLSWTSTNATSCTASNAWTGGKTVPSGSQASGSITTSRTYTLSCTGAGGTSADSVTVNVTAVPPPPPPPAAPTVDLRANGSSGPITITSGTTAALSWTVANATTCTASNAWTGAKTIPTGSQTSSAISANSTFILTCTGAGGSTSDTVQVNVAGVPPPPPPPAAPVTDLRANNSNGPLTVTSGTAVNLSWTVTNATTCTASNGWTGNRTVPSGSQSSGSLISNRTFILTCTGPGGSSSDTVVVNVAGVPPPPLPNVDLLVNGSVGPATILSGGAVTLSWTTTNATSCTATTNVPNAAWTGIKALASSQSSGALTVSATFNLTCTGPGGNITDSVNVNVGSGQCSIPRPNDPPTALCIPNASATGSITWSWPAVAGATEYNFAIEDSTGTVVPGTQTNWQDGQTFFNCRPNTSDICRRTTSALPAGSYRSSILARGACTVSLPGTSNYFDLAICASQPWWQASNGHAVTQGNIVSNIPDTLLNLISNGSGGYPGIALRGIPNGVDTGSGRVSSTEWSAQTSFTNRQADYASFDRLIPVSITPTDPGSSIDQNGLNTSGANADGYSWIKRGTAGPANLDIIGDITLAPGRKVVLFVNGDVNILGKISYDPATSFLIIIARGSINIDPANTSAAGVPTITGIFYADGQFRTGAGSERFSVLGSVAAIQGVALERDLGGIGNGVEPAESFTLSAELLLNYPPALTFKHPSWSEIAP